MVYFTNLFLSSLYTYIVGNGSSELKLSEKASQLMLFPILLVWLLICGGQDNVGTDYQTYLEVFEGFHHWRFEPGFIGLVDLCALIGLKGQSIFFVFYGLGFFFFSLILNHIDRRYWFIYIILYLSFSGLFHSQLNILRQGIATYIGTYGAICIVENKELKGVITLLLATSIHFAAFSFILVFVFRYWKKSHRELLIFILILSTVLSFFVKPEMIDKFSFIIPEYYLKYINSITNNEKIALTKFTKYIYIPIFYLSILKIDKYNLSYLGKILFVIGILSFCLRLILINVTLLNRLVDLYVLFMIYPLYEYIVYLYKNRIFYFTTVCLFFIFIYSFKILIKPSAEYLYSSLYLTLF